MSIARLPSAATDIAFDRRVEDVGNIVEFGHVNLAVPDQQQAIVFYVMGLGLTRDPYLVTGVDNAWINVGRCQFHLPVGPAQLFRGVIGLVLPDLDALVARLAAIEPRLQGTRFGFRRAGALVELSCPWGNRLRVHAPDPARFGHLRLGMPYVEVDTAPGTAAGIARFYTELLAAPSTCDEDAEGVCAQVPVGLNERLLFRESGRALPAYDGHHVQIAVADFSGVHRRLGERALVSEESHQHQYRFDRIVDPDSGVLLLELEHEVRSMRHPMYARPLVNRDPAISNAVYAAGHEAQRWQLPPD